MPRLARSSGSSAHRRQAASSGRALAFPSLDAHAGAATSGVPRLLRSLGIRPSRRLGQNFLVDPRVAGRIAALVTPPGEPVLEIGPGLGGLTVLLGGTGRRLVAVEVDPRLAEVVEGALAPYPDARVARGDILSRPVEGWLDEDGPRTPIEHVTVVGNLPYSITTPAVEWILSQGDRVRRAILMVQREVAQRLAAAPGGKEYGSLTVFVALHAGVRTLFRVSPGAFFPRPEVDSVVLELTPRPYPGTSSAERAEAERLARAGMGTRRKTVVNALARGLAMEPGAVRVLLERAGVDPERRGETLSVEEWIGLARGFLAGGVS